MIYEAWRSIASQLIARIAAMFIIILCLPFILDLCQAANILMLHPIYCGSHEFVLRSLGDHLTSKGHSVTQVRFNHGNSKKGLKTNVSVITLDVVDHLGNCARFVQNGKVDISKVGAKILWDEGHSVLGLPYDIFCLTDCHCHTLFNSPEMEKLLNATKFDVAIVDLIANECSLAMAASLKIPTIGFWGFSFHNGEAAYASSFSPPSLYPAFFSGLNQKMTFLERVQNLAIHWFHRAYMDFQAYYASFYISQKYPDVSPTHKLVHDLELIFVHSNEFVDYPRLLAPNVIQVGGLQLQRDHNGLPKDYVEFMNGADKGVILFSLGYTGFSAKDIPAKVVETLVNTFASLEQRVIMRFDIEVMPYIPDNVMVSSWVPQQDILAHEKTVAFFSHCGFGSVIESVYHGVPLVAVGIFADQLDNAAMLEELGVAVRLLKSQLCEQEAVREALLQVTSVNSSYKKRVDRLSAMWRDQTTSPRDLAAHWIETLLKFGSLSHLRIEQHDFNVLQYFSIDVIALICCLLTCAVIALCSAIKWTMKNQQQQRNQKNKHE